MRQLGGGARELGMMGGWWLKSGRWGGREGKERGEGVDERRYCQKVKENGKEK